MSASAYYPRYRKDMKCHICPEPAICEINSWTNTYYRNKTSNKFYFCSEKCKIEFEKYNRCRDCAYGGDLKFVPEGFMLCDNYPCNLSCYQKYLMRGKLNENCYFCGTDCLGNYDDWELEIEIKCQVVCFGDERSHICETCYIRYKKIDEIKQFD